MADETFRRTETSGADPSTSSGADAPAAAADPGAPMVHPDQLTLAGFDLPAPAAPAEPAATEPGSPPESERIGSLAERVVDEADEKPAGSWRVVALSDLHLDTPFTWAPEEIGRLRRADLRRALTETVALAQRVGADALVLPGDLYEHERTNPDTARFLERVLNDAELPVLVAPGNHDPLTPSSVWATTSWADHVHVFDGRQLEPFTLAEGLTFWGAAHHRPSGTPGFLETASISGPGVHVALFHGSENSGFQAEGRDESGRSKQPHAPFDAAAIPEVGLHHAIVGHFHRRREATHHTYPGNPAPLAFGEPGDGGAVAVDIGSDGHVRRRWYPVSDRPMDDVEIDVTGCLDVTAVADAVRLATTGARGLLRVTLTGELSPGVSLVDDELLAVVEGVDHAVIRRRKLWLGYDLDLIAAENSVRGAFVRGVRDDLALDEDLRADVIATGLRALDGRTDLDVRR